jgi:epoxyqueuosine reductase
VPTEAEPSLEALIKAQAYGLGFDLAGITTLGPAATADKFERWLDRGFAGEMHYMERSREKRRDTKLPRPGTTAAIVVALNYGGTQPSGPISRYARGTDYHPVMEKKLRTLHRWLQEHTKSDIPGKAYVDTGPILERDLARKAGLGWFGKNTNLINPKLGSCFFIGALVVEAGLKADAPFVREHCGSCTRCIDACPTDAILGDGVLDARRCISYQTIEQRGAISAELRSSMGQWIYGCDICQEVCPWNQRFSHDVREQELFPQNDRTTPNLAELLLLSETEFAVRFQRSPIKRTRRSGLARNVAIALGNRGAEGDREALQQALQVEADPLVREHVEWALARLERAPAPDVPSVW